MVELQVMIENTEWSVGVVEGFSFSAMAPGTRVLQYAPEEINSCSRSSASSKRPEALTVAVMGSPWLVKSNSGALPLPSEHTLFVRRDL